MAGSRHFRTAFVCTLLSLAFSHSILAATLSFEITSTATGFSGPVTNEVTVGNWATIGIRSDFPQGHIFYTLNGSEPSPASTPYSQPFTVFTNTTVRASAYSSNLGESVQAQLAVHVVPAYNLRVLSSPEGLVSVSPEHRPPGNPPG